jgi:hypothetical protein
MCLWKFRIDIPGDPPDITIVTAVLARYPARLLNMSMERGCQQATGEFVIDLPHDEGVGPILSTLHDISPRVLIGREKACVTSRPAAATDATAPVTTAPVTTAPVTTAPVTTAPVTTAPVTTAPVTKAPVTAAPVAVAAGTATKASTGQSAAATRTRRAADHRVPAGLRRVSRRRRPGWRA